MNNIVVRVLCESGAFYERDRFLSLFFEVFSFVLLNNELLTFFFFVCNLFNLKRLLKKQLGNFFSISNKWCEMVCFLKLFFEVICPLVLMLKFWSYVIWSDCLFQELECWETDKLNRFCIRERIQIHS